MNFGDLSFMCDALKKVSPSHVIIRERFCISPTLNRGEGGHDFMKMAVFPSGERRNRVAWCFSSAWLYVIIKACHFQKTHRRQKMSYMSRVHVMYRNSPFSSFFQFFFANFFWKKINFRLFFEDLLFKRSIGKQKAEVKCSLT